MRYELEIRKYNDVLERVESVYEDNLQKIEDIYEQLDQDGREFIEVYNLLDDVDVLLRNITHDVMHIKKIRHSLLSHRIELLEGVEINSDDLRGILEEIDDLLTERNLDNFE